MATTTSVKSSPSTRRSSCALAVFHFVCFQQLLTSRDDCVCGVQVPGDVDVVAVGDKIPADCRLIGLASPTMLVDEAMLTGALSALFALSRCT